MNILTDQELRALVASAMRGDREAITSLLKYYTPALYFVSRLYLGDKETAKKSEQQALRSALKQLKYAQAAPDITDWMIDQVRSEALNTLKPVRTSGAYSMYYDSSDEYPNLEDAMAYTEEECRIRILKALDRIAEPERAVLALRFFDHMPIDEIAARMETTTEEIRSLLVSGKAGLRNSGIPAGTLAALCERVNPYEPEAETAGTVEPEEPVVFAAAEPAEVRTETVRETEYRTQEPQTQTVVEQPVEEEEPLLTEPEQDEIPEVAAEVPAAAVAEAVQPAVQEPQAEYEAEEKVMPVRKKKKSHWLLKSLIAILLGAGAAVGLYLYLVMNKAKPAAPQAKPAETQETETVPEETEKPAETEQKPAETEQKPEEKTEEKTEETPAETEDTGEVVGSAEVIVDELRIRAGSGTGFDEVDVAPYGAVYDVYEVRSDNEYMWYRIGDEMWIADSEGSWVTFTPAE